MLADAHAYGVKTVGMVSSTVLPELEKLNKMEPGTLDIHKVIAGMKKEGIDCVVSEEQVIDQNQALAEKLIKTAQGPVILSNSFAVKNFVQEFFPELEHQVTFYPSLQQTFSQLVNEQLIPQFGWESNQVKTVVFTANNENGAEAKEQATADYSMNPREIYRTFLRTGVDLHRIRPTDALKQNPDAAYLYGPATGPVTFNYEKEPEIMRVAGKKIAIAHNLGQCRKLLEEIAGGTCSYDIVRLCA